MLRLTPLSATFGAQVMGVDLASPEARTCASELRDALYEHQVLLFRDQRLTVWQQLAFTKLLGEPVEPWDRTHSHDEVHFIEVFHASPPRDYLRPAEHWHTDGSFLAEPTCATLLYAVVVPRSGGHTHFANARAAYASLRPDLLHRVAGLRAVHSFCRQFSGLREASRRVSSDEAHLERATFPDVEHDLIRYHPATGTPAIYLNQLCLDRVLGLGEADGTRLLDALYAHTLRPEFRYEHAWRPGDLLVWDNPSLLHRASPVAPGQSRLVHRSTARYLIGND